MTPLTPDDRDPLLALEGGDADELASEVIARRRRRGLWRTLTLALLLLPSLAQAIIVVTPPGVTCATDSRLTAPVAGQDTCYDATIRGWFGWSGTAWFPLQVVTPEMYGAAANGTTDDATPIANALAANPVVVLTPGKSYNTGTTGITLGQHSSLLGSSWGSTIIYSGTGCAVTAGTTPQATSDDRANFIGGFTIDITAAGPTTGVCIIGTNANKANYHRVFDLKILGNGTGSAPYGTQAGVLVQTAGNGQAWHNLVDNIVGRNLRYVALVNNQGGASTTPNANEFRHLIGKKVGSLAKNTSGTENSYSRLEGDEVGAAGVACIESSGNFTTFRDVVCDVVNAGGAAWNLGANNIVIWPIFHNAPAASTDTGTGNAILDLSSLAGGATALLKGSLNLSGLGTLINVPGISATGTAAKNLDGSCTFSAATTCTVTFATPEPDISYRVSLGCNANKTFFWSGLLTTGFTINASSSSSDTCHWHLAR